MVPEMEKGKNESILTSPAAFVEGGIQEACDDSCSICLEEFCDSDPRTVTVCKHEFHLQCILEWCQRSSNCPMCWQAIRLKDPTSQELLEAVEHERSLRFNPTRNSTILRHPTLGDFQLPFGVNDGVLEDRIIQHLAAAAAMGRAHHVSRREGSRNRSAAHVRPQFLVFSSHPSAIPEPDGGEAEPPVVALVSPSVPPMAGGGETVQPLPTSGTPQGSNNQQGTTVIHRSSSSQSYLLNQDRAGTSELQTVSDSWKSRLGAISTRYKESLSKSTQGWKERLFNRSSSVSSIGSEARRGVNDEIAVGSRETGRLSGRSRDEIDDDRNAAVLN